MKQHGVATTNALRPSWRFLDCILGRKNWSLSNLMLIGFWALGYLKVRELCSSMPSHPACPHFEWILICYFILLFLELNCVENIKTVMWDRHGFHCSLVDSYSNPFELCFECHAFDKAQRHGTISRTWFYPEVGRRQWAIEEHQVLCRNTWT